MSYTEQFFRIQIIVLFIALTLIVFGLITVLVINIYQQITEWHIEKTKVESEESNE